MSTYVRNKVLRIPESALNLDWLVERILITNPEVSLEDINDDMSYYLESTFPELFGYASPGMFMRSPTEEAFIDYVLEHEYDVFGEYGKVRDLSEREKTKYLEIFKQLDPNIDMNKVRLVEYCWYNGTEAPSYYEFEDDGFYKEV